ncbi:MAG: hypothetical protein ACOC1F_08820 [Myxococcota bacterium]
MADKALATALFKEGRELLEQNQIEKACHKFQESQHLDPSGGTLLNLAACHERMGRTASAWTEYNEALAWARRDGRMDRVQFAAEHMKALEPKLSYIVVEVPAAAQRDGLEVRRDGRPLRRAAWGSRMPVDPGRHVIDVAADGYEPWRTEVVVEGEGVEQRVIVPALTALGPTDGTSDEPTVGAWSEQEVRTQRRSSSGVGAMPYVLGGVGLVGIGAGTYFGLRAFSKDEEADEACVNGCTPAGEELTDEARQAADISTAGFAVGLVGVGAALTLLLLGSETEEASGIGPVVSPDHAGVRWEGRF